MQKDQITILSCKVGKKIEMGYFHIPDAKNYSVEDDESPHPDFYEALYRFNSDLAKALHVDMKNDIEQFRITGFIIYESNGNFSIELKGKVTTVYDDIVNCSSGKIPYNENGEVINNMLDEKIRDIRDRLFDYMFNGINAQQKIPFEE